MDISCKISAEECFKVPKKFQVPEKIFRIPANSPIRSRFLWSRNRRTIAGICFEKDFMETKRFPISGLPDGLFSNQKSQIWVNFGGPLLVCCCFRTVCFILWPFGIIYCGHLLYFSRFGMFGPRKIWQPCSQIPRIRLAAPQNPVDPSMSSWVFAYRSAYVFAYRSAYVFAYRSAYVFAYRYAYVFAYRCHFWASLNSVTRLNEVSPSFNPRLNKVPPFGNIFNSLLCSYLNNFDGFVSNLQ
jgi:hypothetical protein